jgi:hypothetical protein
MRTMTTTLAFLALSATPAAAQCAQDQLTGDWTLLGSNNGAWTSCALEVDVEGVFEGRCRGTGRRPPRTGAPVDGFLEVNAACDLDGSFGSGNAAQAIEGVLDEGGTVGAGVTKFGTRRQNFGLLFTLVKRPTRGAEE